MNEVHVVNERTHTMGVFTPEEVAKHNTRDDLWIIVNGKVYDVTNFLQDHPGGKTVLLKEGGKDASKKFKLFHGASVLSTYGPELQVGVIGSSLAAAESKKRVAQAKAIEMMGAFGDLIPYGDPAWYSGFSTDYYNDSHKRCRAAVRAWVEAEIMPFVDQWDEQKTIPSDIFHKAAEAGFLGVVAGLEWPTEYAGPNIIGGVKPEEFDAFHCLIITDELARCGSGGVLWGLFGGMSIGLPPVLHFASKELKDRIARPCLQGQKTICLAVTEASAGSDVAHLECTARKTEDGKFYIVNGQKKWITNGTFADYFTTAVRTGGEGAMGVSLLLIERERKGVSTKQMHCSGVWSSGTAYVNFDNVKVPVENIIGNENEGFKCIMHNFNQERWGVAIQASRFARVCLEESIKYALKRKTFGKPLIQHQVIRHKLAHMATRVESAHAWLESLTHQLATMDRRTAMLRLGGPIALLKANASQNLEFCAREAQQIMGGLGYTRGGQGAKVERLAREVRAYAVPAGSEEIMWDLSAKMAERQGRFTVKMLDQIQSRM